MADAIWYYVQAGDRKGPVSAETVKALVDAGAMDPATLVWREGMGEWEPAFRHIGGVIPPAPGRATGGSHQAAASPVWQGAQGAPYGQGVGFGRAFSLFWSGYADFSGRSVRSEFWWWIVWAIILGAVATSLDYLFVDMTLTFTPINWVWSLITLIPTLALGARRLHDVNRSGWWQLIALTGIGIILLIVWWAQPSDQQRNTYG